MAAGFVAYELPNVYSMDTRPQVIWYSGRDSRRLKDDGMCCAWWIHAGCWLTIRT